MSFEWPRSGPLKPGLPRLLIKDPQRLCKLVGMNRKKRRVLWHVTSKEERARIQAALRDADNELGISRNVALVLSNEAVPGFRRMVWDDALAGKDGSRSLNFDALRGFVREERQQAAAGKKETEKRTPSERIAGAAWDHTRARLDDWDELPPEERTECILRLFAVATVLDEQGVLVKACRQVPSLREEFGNMVPEDEDPAQAWARLCGRLEELVKKAAGPPPEPDEASAIEALAKELHTLAPVMGEHVATSAREALLEAAREARSKVRESSDSGWFDEAVRGKVQHAWKDVAAGISLVEIDAERERLATAAPQAMEAVRRAEAARASAKRQVRKHREKPPDSFIARKAWNASLANLRSDEDQCEEALWDAQRELVAAVSPFGEFPDSEEEREPRGPQPAPRPPEPEPEPVPPDPDPEPVRPEPDPEAGPPEPEPEPGPPEPDPEPGPPEPDPEPGPPEPEPEPGPPEPEPEPGRPEPEPEPVPPEPEPEPVPQRATAPLVARVETAVFDALGESPPRLAVAVQATRLLEAEAPHWNTGRSRLLEGALFADRLRDANGVLCGALAEVFGDLPPFDAELDQEDRGFQIACRIAASLVPSLVAPNSGAFAVLRNLPSGPFPLLRELAHGVSQHVAKLQTADVGPHFFRRLGSDSAAIEACRKMEAEVDAWRLDAPRRTMKYQPATAVWRHWLQQGGWIGDLMTRIDAATETETELRAEIQRLRSEDELRKRVTATDRKLRGHLHRRGAIRWQASAKLLEEARRLADLLERYLSARAAATGERDYRLTVLSALARDLDGCVEQACAELEAVRGQAHGWSSAGARLAERSVRRLQGLLRGIGLEEAAKEPAPENLVASGFYRSAVVLDRNGHPAGARGAVLDCLVGTPLDSLSEAAQRHLDSGELDMAHRILEWSIFETGEQEEQLEGLRARLEETRQQRLEATKGRLRSIEDRMESGVILGSVSADERQELEGTLVEARLRLRQRRFYRFAEIERALDRTDRRLGEMAQEHHERVLSELSGLHLNEGSTAKHAIERALAQKDFVVANELIARVHKDSDFTPPEPVANDLFSDFFPRVEAATSQALERARSSEKVLATIRQGRRFPGVPRSLPGARRKSAVRMLEAWYKLKERRRLAHNNRDVKQLFTEIGFADVAITPAGPSVACLTTAPLKSKHHCPVPLFGSTARGRYSVIFQWERPAIADLMHADRNESDPPILLYFGRLSARQRGELAHRCRQSASTLLVLDETVLVSLCGERGSRLPALFHRALPFTFVQPYITTGGEVPPEMFYGRAQERRAVASRTGPCFIYGGRQLGKTAILRAVRAKRHDPPNERYAFVVDVKSYGIGVARDPAELWPLLWDILHRDGAIPPHVREPSPKVRRSVDSFLERLIEHFDPESGRRLLLLLDEADHFLEVDSREQEPGVAASGYPQSIRLKRLMDQTDRSIKVVFAGLHNVLRTAKRANHPLGQFGDPIQVGPLLENGEMRRAYELLTRPLMAAGCRIAAPNLVTRILAQTNFYPGLIQACGKELVGAMASNHEGQPLYEVTPEIVEETFRSRGLREFIRNRFQLTLDLDRRYEVIAYAIARLCAGEDQLLVDGISFSEIRSEVLRWWEEGFRDSTPERFRSLLDEMEGLGVVRRLRDGNWSLRTPNVLLLMGTRERIEEKLLQDREPPPEFQRETFHGRLNPAKPSDPGRNPMTFQQEGQLLAEENGIIVLSGVRAAGRKAAVDGLRSSVHSPAVPLWAAHDPQSLVEELRSHVAEQEEAVRAYLVPHENGWSGQWIRAARKYLGRLSRSDRWIRLVFVADGEAFWRLIVDEERTAPTPATILGPWHEDYLRQWLQDIGIVATPELRQSILDVTGGWHLHLMRFAKLARDGNGEAGAGSLQQELSDPERRATLREQLCLGDPKTRLVLRPFIVYGEDGALRREEAREEAVEQGMDRSEAGRRLEWARRMGLVRAGRTWRINPLVARLLGADDKLPASSPRESK